MRVFGIRFGWRAALLGGILGSVCFLWGSGATAQTPGATATLASTGPGAYALTLNNTGSTTIGTLWYAWVPGEDFMGVSPTSVTSPSGWTDTITGGGGSDGYAIQWTAMSSASYLQAGQSLSGFDFDSTQSLTQLTTADSPFYPTTPVGTSFTYHQGAFSDAGDQFVVSPVPEPSTAALAIVCGAALLGARAWRRRTCRS